MGRHKAQRNERARKSFETRYNMIRSEFRELRKNNPKEAHELRMRVCG